MTGGDIPLADYTYKAGVSFAAKQFYGVYIDSSGLAQLATSGYPMMGIMQDNPAASSRGAVRELGHSKAVILTGCTMGDPLKVSSTAGQLTTGTLASDIIVAVALETATATGQVIEVALTARTAQGVGSRVGHLVYRINQVGLTTTKAIYTALPLGFSGTIKDWFILYTTASTGSSGAGTLDLLLTTAATPRQLYTTGTTATTITLNNSTAVGTKVASNAAPTLNNTFVDTDTLEIHTTNSTTFASCAGVFEVHIITN